eukprot:m.288800 g.288800  ORF g.288800 m.288800 type:complete len:106 (+) comp27101_c0_seq8:948-1265(+)
MLCSVEAAITTHNHAQPGRHIGMASKRKNKDSAVPPTTPVPPVPPVPPSTPTVGESPQPSFRDMPPAQKTAGLVTFVLPLDTLRDEVFYETRHMASAEDIDTLQS